jgi:hypothetical protein
MQTITAPRSSGRLQLSLLPSHDLTISFLRRGKATKQLGAATRRRSDTAASFAQFRVRIPWPLLD